MSTKFTPVARRRTRAWPCPGAGTGTSSSFRTSGPPAAWNRIAFIIDGIGSSILLPHLHFALAQRRGEALAHQALCHERPGAGGPQHGGPPPGAARGHLTPCASRGESRAGRKVPPGEGAPGT